MMEESGSSADPEGGGCQEVTFLSVLQHKYSDEDYRVLFASLLCQERERERRQQEQENRPLATDNRRDLACPPCVVLQNFGINRVGCIEELSRFCVHLREIDLSFNQLSKWSEISPLIQQTAHLESLNLSFNPLSSLSPADVLRAGPCPLCPLQAANSPRECGHPGPPLRRLILNGTRIDFAAVLALLDTLLPHVEELHLSLNDYASLPDRSGDAPPRHRLRELHVDNNQLHSWKELLRIGHTFPALHTLFASYNPLADLEHMEESALRDSLPSLAKLHLNHTHLDAWPALDRLQHLPRLTDLRLLNTPLWTASSPPVSPASSPSKQAPFSPALTTRQHILARLPALTLLNGTPVESLERMDAERAFLRHFHAQPAPCPRFAQLQAAYGPLAPLLAVELGAPEYVEVGLSYGTVSRRPWRCNVKQTVGQLRRELQRLAGMQGGRVFYLDAVTGWLEEMRGDRRAVHSFNVREGDEISVQPK